ncbi:type I restriction enzyme HsdR N-terminal domain-containing protein [Bacillus sp. PS06]|uniref:type I restriction enzyme HsdR N-terminal domain-containing protein n=1 Tax=Bacillus sp. PS06 TaxID=2764176 RepID=UPI0017831528|nr:type I restriction enzyme HsdR N-terminal domain-containing protein [Bacillus sp. PS06]MBD8069748.1 type I restriction enzyme HsdR N-terminal domain-containing protein [Bacillus sp. PS06]
MKIYKNGRKKLIFDPCRQILLQYTPEEEVRQKIIEVLIEDMKIPRDTISTEFALSKVDSTSKKRADIVVWHKDRDGNEHALIVLEIKATHIELTNHTLEQVKSYNEILKAKYIGISNGQHMQLYELKNGNTVPLTNELYTYSELLKGKVEYTKFRELRRLPYELATYDRYVKFLLNEGYIGEGTPTDMHPFISELQNFILCGEVNISSNYRTEIIEDLSNGIFSFGNASGGGFPGYYRSFIVKDLGGKHSIYRIGIFGTAVMVNDPVYGNRNGNTYLIVAVDNSGLSTNILQLNIDQFISISEEQKSYEIFHNGRRNGFTNRQVIENIKQSSPELIVDEKIFLGSLPAQGSISIKDGSEFIERLVEYASVRVKLAEKKRKENKEF